MFQLAVKQIMNEKYVLSKERKKKQKRITVKICYQQLHTIYKFKVRSSMFVNYVSDTSCPWTSQKRDKKKKVAFLCVLNAFKRG